MIKSMFKRTWLSIKRKPNKSVVLILLMFVMANLVLASLLIKSAVSENIEAVKESLGSEIYLSTDMTSIMDSMEIEMTEESMQSGGQSMMNIERSEIPLSMVLEIGTSDYVRDLTYSASSTAYAVDFESYSYSSSEDDEDDESLSSNFDARSSFQSTQMIGDVLIEGINSYAFIDGVDSGSITIYDGTYFDESTDDQIMISYELAYANDLEVGDFIELQNVEDEVSYSLKIIGIFTNDSSGSENTIYMNIETASYFFLSDQLTDEGEYIVNDVVYYLTNPDDADAFIEEAYEKYPDLKDDNLTLDINNEAYEAMAGSIEQVGEFADTILIVVIVASVLIIALLINNNVKDRIYEIGVLSALGATKMNIIGQIFMELVITATIGFILSFGTSYFIANSLADSLLENEISSSEITEESSFGRPSTGTSGGVSNIPGMNIESSSITTSDVEVVDDIDVSVSITSYLLLFVIGYLVSFVAMIIPARNIMKYEPKTILTGRQ